MNNNGITYGFAVIGLILLGWLAFKLIAFVVLMRDIDKTGRELDAERGRGNDKSTK